MFQGNDAPTSNTLATPRDGAINALQPGLSRSATARIPAPRHREDVAMPAAKRSRVESRRGERFPQERRHRKGIWPPAT